MGQNTQAFEQLRSKYQAAINLMQQLQVQGVSVTMEGNKLLVRGTAPSSNVKNRVWDQIKLIDSNYPDLVCDITVSEQQRQAPSGASMTAGAAASGGQAQRRYTVQPGDTLSKISRQFYGDANQYTKIFNANRNVLPDANTIRPGQELVIPE
jgi:nucleoid-associated protein YgaU